MPTSAQSDGDPSARVSVIRIDSLLDAAQALAAKGYVKRAAELIGQARAELARLDDEVPKSGADEPAGCASRVQGATAA